VTTILVPFHLDEYLPDLNVPLREGVTTVAPPLAEGDVWSRLGQLYEAVADAVTTNGSPVTVVSGDCTTSLGTMAGLRRAGVDAAVVWFDAHGDVQSLETTASGYIGGMPLRILTGYRPELIARRLGLVPVPEERIVLVDARDLDPPEADYLATARIRRSSVEALDAAALPPGPLLVHVDLDVVDAGELSGLRYPVAGGPSLDAVVAAVRRVRDTGRVAGVDIACTWHPGHDDVDNARARLVSSLIA
jgi:arginase